MTPRPFKTLGGLATSTLAALALSSIAPAMANHQQAQHHAGRCQQMLKQMADRMAQSGSAVFPRVAVGCSTNPNGGRGYVSSSDLYNFIRTGGKRIVISESQEVSIHQWAPHPSGINGRQVYDSKGNNVLIIH